MRTALIHRARLLIRSEGARNAQGEYASSDPPTPGPWFRARLMERGAAAKGRRRENSTEARVSAPYELLADFADMETGAPVVLTASSLIETDCPILGSPTLELAGKPETLNNGRRLIGFMALANRAQDAA